MMIADRLGRAQRPLFVAATAAALALIATVPFALAQSAGFKSFTFSEKANERLAKKMNLPPFFALPASARGAVPDQIKTTDVLVDFKHPDPRAKDLGLRLVVTKRAGMSRRLGQSGLFKTGDILLTFRPEWGGAGAYPNIQMGISHTGLAYIKDGELRNIDNPLTDEYHGRNMRSNLTGEHYGTLNYLHIVRPRGLDDAQRANLLGWIERLKTSSRTIYPEQIKFNQDYNAPKFHEGKQPEFVKRLGLIALGKGDNGGPALDMYCSEFVWSLLSLRKCDPVKTAADFENSGIPSCIEQPMVPLHAVGSFAWRQTRGANVGLADGPLMVIDAMKLDTADRLRIIASMFAENEQRLKQMSIGHQQVAREMAPRFEPLRRYYDNATGNRVQRVGAGLTASAFTRNVPDNYSPTSYLINTLLPPDNSNRTMDYIATIVIE
jgi:hypothetical protein